MRRNLAVEDLRRAVQNIVVERDFTFEELLRRVLALAHVIQRGLGSQGCVRGNITLG